MTLPDQLDTVQRHLKKLRAKITFQKSKPGKEADVRKAEKIIGLSFPEQLRQVYLKYADGFVFFWERGDDAGGIVFPTLAALVEDYQEWKHLVLWMDNHDFPHVKNPKLAKSTYKRMKRWLPLFSEGNCDAFCLVCDPKKSPVVYHRHDWYDGGSGDNGHVVGPDLEKFLADWSRVCFAGPKTLYWPGAFAAKGVDWTGEEFDEKYIVHD